MEQSTKLFLVLAFMFVIYTTLNGHLEKYLRILFGKAPVHNAGSTIGDIGSAVGSVAENQGIADVFNMAASMGATAGLPGF